VRTKAFIESKSKLRHGGFPGVNGDGPRDPPRSKSSLSPITSPALIRSREDELQIDKLVRLSSTLITWLQILAVAISSLGVHPSLLSLQPLVWSPQPGASSSLVTPPRGGSPAPGLGSRSHDEIGSTRAQSFLLGDASNFSFAFCLDFNPDLKPEDLGETTHGALWLFFF
jgi:hypothetical protein